MILNLWKVILSGLQLGYTVVFGSYASFLFIQTGRCLLTLFYIIVTVSLVLDNRILCYMHFKTVHYMVSFPLFPMRYVSMSLICVILISCRTFSCSFSCSRILQFYGTACASFTGKRYAVKFPNQMPTY